MGEDYETIKGRISKFENKKSERCEGICGEIVKLGTEEISKFLRKIWREGKMSVG